MKDQLNAIYNFYIDHFKHFYKKVLPNGKRPYFFFINSAIFLGVIPKKDKTVIIEDIPDSIANNTLLNLLSLKIMHKVIMPKSNKVRIKRIISMTILLRLNIKPCKWQ